MKNLASPHSIQKILKCYSSFGDKKLKIGSSFEYYHCPMWKNSIMSPIYITSQKNWEKDLAKVVANFKNPYKKSPLNAAAPYFNLTTNDSTAVDKKLILKLEKLGWHTTNIDYSLNLWTKPLELKIPKGIQIKVGNYFDPLIYPHFLKTMEDNFAIDDTFMKYFNKMLKTIEQDVMTVMLCKNEKVIGAVVVAVKNESACLLCGSINKEFRKKKLWNVLNAATQGISAAKGAKVWIYTTAQPELLWRGDETYRTTVFTYRGVV